MLKASVKERSEPKAEFGRGLGYHMLPPEVIEVPLEEKEEETFDWALLLNLWLGVGLFL
jgi:hypothetical protein